MNTIQNAFEKAGLTRSPGYEGFYYHNDPFVSDFAWFRYDANDTTDVLSGIQVFDEYDWTPIEECIGYTVEEAEILRAQIPNGIPLNDLPLSVWALDKLPGIIQDIWSGRFVSIE